MQTLVVSSVMYFTLERSSFKIEWLISPEWEHLNSYLARGGGNLNTNFPKIQVAWGLLGGGGMLKLRFERYISKHPYLCTCNQILNTKK